MLVKYFRSDKKMTKIKDKALWEFINDLSK